MKYFKLSLITIAIVFLGVLLFNQTFVSYSQLSEYDTINSALEKSDATNIDWYIFANIKVSKENIQNVMDDFELKNFENNKYRSKINDNTVDAQIVCSNNEYWIKLNINNAKNIEYTFDIAKSKIKKYENSRIFLNAIANSNNKNIQRKIHNIVLSKEKYKCNSNIDSISGYIYNNQFQVVNNDINFQTAFKKSNNENSQVVVGIPAIEILF